MAKQRNYSTEFKPQVVLGFLPGEKRAAMEPEFHAGPFSADNGCRIAIVIVNRGSARHRRERCTGCSRGCESLRRRSFRTVRCDRNGSRIAVVVLDRGVGID